MCVGFEVVRFSDSLAPFLITYSSPNIFTVEFGLGDLIRFEVSIISSFFAGTRRAAMRFRKVLVNHTEEGQRDYLSKAIPQHNTYRY